MVVAHNLSAINTSRQFGITNKSQAKSTQKLSSGYRINRAADDAAGLAISEKMRRQIRGLTQASLNCQDGVSMMQVADGALDEMASIMQRMNELAVKSANGTLQASDRQAINDEATALKQELGRIQNATSFNEIYIFKPPRAVEINAPDYGHASFDEAGTVNGYSVSRGKTMDFGNLKTPEQIAELDGKSFSIHCSAGCSQIFKFSFKNDGSGSEVTLSGGGDRPNLLVTIDLQGLNDGTDIASEIYRLTQLKSAEIPDKDSTKPFTYIGHANGISADDSKLYMFAVAGGGNGYVEAAEIDFGLQNIQIQAGTEVGQTIDINLYAIGPGSLGVSGIDLTTVRGSQSAIDSIKGGLATLSRHRSYYGAIQNRLEHTIKNLDNVVENTTAAESRIRDTYMADEMVSYSNNNILLQAGVSMMAQANQSNQMVLSLLRQ